MRGRFRRSGVERRNSSRRSEAFQLGRVLMVALIVIVLIALLVALLD